MATVTFTPYHSTDKSATKRTVAYVLDGHLLCMLSKIVIR